MANKLPPPPVTGPEPDVVRDARLTRGVIRELRRDGADDGRRGDPEPTQVLGPATTGTRNKIMREMEEAIAGAHNLYAARIVETERERTVQLSMVELWQVRLENATAEAERILAGVPPLERFAGETHLPASTVRKRRHREREKVAGPLHRECAALRQNIAVAQQRAAELDARVTAFREELDKLVEWLVAAYHSRRAVYDRALLRRHPLRELVRPMLQGASPGTPDWPPARWVAPAEVVVDE